MSRKPYPIPRRLIRAVLAVAAPLLLCLLLRPAPLLAAPNVLLIVVDDLRAELGSYGNPLLRTPNIDRLAGQGVKFTNAFSQFPLCNPSRSSFLLGRYPSDTGVSGNRTSFRTKHPDYLTLPQHFRQNGYDTISIGKIFHVQDPVSWSENYLADGGEDSLPSDPRRDAWFWAEGKAADALADDKITDRALLSLATARTRPWFLAVGYRRPHTRWVCPKNSVDLYPQAQMPLPVNFYPRPTAPPGVPAAAVRPRNADLFQNESVTPERARIAIASYFGCISHVDDQVGRLLGELDRRRLRGNTIVVFLSDHGYQLGERGRWSKHGSLYDAVGRVPLIIDAPGTRGRGQASSRLVELVDLFPTLAQLAGLPAVAGLKGASLAPLLDDPAAARNRPAFAQVGTGAQGEPGGKTIRTVEWRYTEWTAGKDGVELYDQRNDPLELTNLAQKPAYATIVAQMKSKLRNGPFQK